jgi:hypothetical protein
MAFGIDDALMTAAAGISLTDTVVKTVQSYRRKGQEIDIELLIEEVRVTAIKRIDDADYALTQFERTLVERGVDTSKTLQNVISSTSWWRPFEQYRLKGYRESFNALANAAYSAADDIAALVKCKNQTEQMGNAVVESGAAKHKLNEQLLNAPSVKDAIEILRAELSRQKTSLMSGVQRSKRRRT